MQNSEIEQIVQDYIKNNLKIKIREENHLKFNLIDESISSHQESVYVDLVLNNEIISSYEIEKLKK